MRFPMSPCATSAICRHNAALPRVPSHHATSGVEAFQVVNESEFSLQSSGKLQPGKLLTMKML